MKRQSQGVSPVIAVILMVAVTVVLSASIGTFVLDLGEQTDSNSHSNVGVSLNTGDNGTVTAQLIDKGGVDKVIVRNASGVEKNISTVGGTVKINSSGEPVTVISKKDGELNVVQRYTPTSTSSSSSTTVSRTGVIDDWEDGDYAEYGATYNGNKISMSTTTVFEGGNSLRVDPVQYDGAAILSSSGLDKYPQQGDTFKVRLYPTYDADSSYEYHQPAVFFGTGSKLNSSDGKPENGYTISMRMGPSDDMFISRDVDGTGTKLNTTTVQWGNYNSANSWLTIEVKWGTNGDINTTVYHQDGSMIAQINATDTTHTSGGFGVSNAYGDNGANHQLYWDIANITASG